MKKILDKLLNVDKKVLIFLAIISIIGIITGSLFMTILSTNDRELINSSLDTFMTQYGQINMQSELTNNFLINLLYAFGIWLLGISIIGLPIVIFLIFMKSFLLSFTISSFIMKYKAKGIFLGIIYNLPHQVINLLIFIYLGIYSIKLSLYIIETIIHKKNLNFKHITNRYVTILCLGIIVLLLSSLYETYLMPILLKKVLSIKL